MSLTNQDVLAIYQNKSILKGLGGFKLAKAVVLNMKMIENELIEVTKEMTKDLSEDEQNKVVEEILLKPCEIKFITISDEEIPGDVTVEQYSILTNFME